MGSPEIFINYSNIISQKSAAAQVSNALRLGKLDAEDSGNSAAVKEFVSIYNDFSGVINDYITVLNSDLERVMSAVGQINEVDKAEGVSLQGIQSNVKYRR